MKSAMDHGAQPKNGDADNLVPQLTGKLARHVASLINPIQDQMKKLAAEIPRLRGEIQMNHASIEKAKGEIARGDREILSQRGLFGEMGARLDRLKIEIAQEHEDRVTLEGELHTTKGHVERVEHEVEKVQKLANMTESKMPDLDARLGTLQFELVGTQNTVTDYRKEFALMRDAHEDLCSQHASLEEAHREAREVSDNAHRGFSPFFDKFQSMLQQHDGKIARLAEHVKTIDEFAASMNLKIVKQVGALQSMDADVDRLRPALEFDKNFEALQARVADALTQVRKQGLQIHQVEEGVERLGNSFVEEKKKHSEGVRDLDRRVHVINTEIRVLEDMHSKRDEKLKKADASAGELRGEQHNMKEQASNIQREVTNLINWQKATATKIEKQAVEHHRTTTELQVVGRNLEHTHAGMVTLKEGMGAASWRIGNMSNRLDGCSMEIRNVGHNVQEVVGMAPAKTSPPGGSVSARLNAALAYSMSGPPDNHMAHGA